MESESEGSEGFLFFRFRFYFRRLLSASVVLISTTWIVRFLQFRFRLRLRLRRLRR